MLLPKDVNIRLVALFFLGVILFEGGVLTVSSNETFIPKEGFVPYAETAIRIAEAVWLPIYGKSIYNEKPFVAKLKEGEVWIVKGTFPKGLKKGGVAYIEIQKTDGKILKVIHGK